MNPGIRRGFTLIELLVAVLVAVVLTMTALSVFIAQHRAFVASILRAEIEGAFDLTGLALTSEIGAGVQSRDWIAGRGDSISLRAFRASAKVCESVGPVLYVEAAGDRTVDPAKDSVLVLEQTGTWHARAVLGVGSGQRRCAPLSNSTSETWVLDAAVDGAVVARAFERGTYFLGGGALRYRRGRSGRQPLTAIVLDSVQSGLSPFGTAGLEIRLTSSVLHRGLVARSWNFRGWQQGGAP